MSNEPPRPSPATDRPASRLEIGSWMLFDFANSSYTTLIVTVAYSVYFTKTVAAGAGYEKGEADALWGAANSISQILVVLSAPFLGAVADHSAKKKAFLLISYAACVVGTASLGLVGPGAVYLGMALFVASNFFYSSGENLIAAFLPELVPPEQMGRVSGMGWAVGYVGGLVSLLACYPLIKEGFGVEQQVSVRSSFVVVAGFFLVGGLPTFLFLRERARPKSTGQRVNYFRVGFRRVMQTVRQARRYRQLVRFLVIFGCFNSGIIIVVVFAAIYAERQIRMSGTEIMIFFMIVQVSASLGAFAFGYLQDRTSAKTAIQLAMVCWLAAIVGAYLTPPVPPGEHSPTSVGLFYVVGNLAGVAMGAAQSSARALVGIFSPVARSGEFFGLWGLTAKLSAVVGPSVYGFASWRLGERTAILCTGAFFVVGLVGMMFVDEAEGSAAATEP